MQYKIPVMADLVAEGKTADVLFWIGCAGSFDQRAQRITIAFAKILNQLNINFAVLGTEEACTGDPARRAGNEFVFQMLAQQNIATLNNYGIKKILTICPHCFNTMKNEYPALGGNYEVLHHSVYLQQLLNEGKLKVEGGTFKGKRITYHDPCYLGRGNGVYEAPRAVIESLDVDLAEVSASREKGLCCGAGGAQMFKEEEAGDKRINTKRTEQLIEVLPDIIAVACPYCTTMITDGVKGENKQDEVKVLDIAELIAQNNNY
ncbi:MAG: hypothetical protein RJA25_1656 [Bacteroidota bacterium]|jgi:Fe-S oxidoreductase